MENLVECLKCKNEKLTELLEYCSSKKFKISKDELEHFENFLVKKTKICKQITKLDELISSFSHEKDEEELELISKNNDLIGQILTIDRTHIVLFDKIQELFKSDVKNIKNSVKTNNAYSGIYTYVASKGSYFDSKR